MKAYVLQVYLYYENNIPERKWNFKRTFTSNESHFGTDD